MTIAEKMNVRGLKSAGLETVPQQSNMSEWLAFRKCLDIRGIDTQNSALNCANGFFSCSKNLAMQKICCLIMPLLYEHRNPVEFHALPVKG